MNVIELATQLAYAVQQDERYEVLDKARRMNDTDEELQEGIGRFNMARIDLNAELNRAERDTAKVKELENNVNAIYTQVMQNESMQAYNEAKNEIDQLMRHINAILAAAINGGDPADVQDPATCGGDCNGCNACG